MNRTWLKTYRKKLGITQEELTARLQVSGFEVTAATISHWETGRYKPPIDQIEFRNAIASILRISPQELLTAAGYETEQHHSELAERAADIVDSLKPEQQRLVIGILEQFLEHA